MQKSKKEIFLMNRLLVWSVALAVAFVCICLVDVVYTASATTYTSTTTLSDYHKEIIAFMQENRYSSLNTVIFKYDIVDGKYIVDFALIYNLICLMGFACCTFSALNACYYFGSLVQYRNKKRIHKAVKHTSAMYNLRQEMRYKRNHY